MEEQFSDDRERRERHRQRAEEMRRNKRRQMMMRRKLKKYAPIAAGAVAVLLLIFGGIKAFHKPSHDSGEKQGSVAAYNGREVENDKDIQDENVENVNAVNKNMQEEGKEESESAVGQGKDALGDNGGIQLGAAAGLLKGEGKQKTYAATLSEDALKLQDKLAGDVDFFSQYALLIDLESSSVIAEKGYRERINPASMTKILTVLVAAEHVKDLDDTLIITTDITDYGYVNGCTSAGFAKDEVVTLRDLFYGTVLPSGADAAVGLAVYVAGSQDAFVELMNEKLKELGLSETTHFTNCVGVYGEDHYSTVYDIAMILEAALDNEWCRDFLTAHTYTTSKTEQHPEGIELSNWFLRRIEDKDCGGEVLYGKTGFVEQSGSCAASYAQDKDGKGYVCVTVGASNKWRCIRDHANLYKQFLG